VLDADALIARVQELSDEIEQLADPHARELAQELVGAVIQMYGEGLERTLGAIAAAGPAGEPIRDALVADGVVGSLMLIHDLYPVPLEERVIEALDKVRPYMESHDGGVELLGIEDGVATLRLDGSCDGCAASAATLELAIKQALDEAAPDLAGLVVQGAVPEPTAGPGLPLAGNGNGAVEPTGFELPILQTGNGAPGGNGAAPSPAAAPAWFEIEGVADLPAGESAAVVAGGIVLLVAHVNGSLLAYRDACAACGNSLVEGEIAGDALTCPACSKQFSLTFAGRSLDGDGRQLDPVPLLREDDVVKVAVAA